MVIAACRVGEGETVLTAVGQPWTLHGDEASCQCCILEFEGHTLALIWADSQRLFVLCCWSLRYIFLPSDLRGWPTSATTLSNAATGLNWDVFRAVSLNI